MAEYIEREALLGAIDCEFFKTHPDGAEQIGVLKCRRIADTLPAADVAEVVRCKDCRWWNHAGCAIRIVDDTDKPQANDFCSYGEPKGERRSE